MNYRTLALAASLAILAAPGAAHEPSNHANEHKRVVTTPETEETYQQFRFAPSLRTGNTLYLSGVVAEQREGEADPTAAYERAFAEVEALLAANDASWANVVDVTSYHTDFKGDFLGFWAFKQDRVPAPYPAWTAIGVSDLFAATGGRAVVEIKVTAVLAE